jgi:hypothetical protein
MDAPYVDARAHLSQRSSRRQMLQDLERSRRASPHRAHSHNSPSYSHKSPSPSPPPSPPHKGKSPLQKDTSTSPRSPHHLNGRAPDDGEQRAPGSTNSSPLSSHRDTGDGHTCMSQRRMRARADDEEGKTADRSWHEFECSSLRFEVDAMIEQVCCSPVSPSLINCVYICVCVCVCARTHACSS